MPGHQFREEQCGDRGVALGKIEAGADAAAFFAANQNILLEHQLADVLEADGDFVELAPELRCESVDEFCDRKGFRNIARQVASSGEMPDEESENLMGIDERTIAVDGADAVAIAIGAERGIVFSGAHRLAGGFDVRLDRLRMNSGEARISTPANFIASDAISREEIAKQTRGGAMHGIAEEAELGIAQTLPIDKFLDGVEIWSARLEGLDQLFARGKRRNAVALHFFELAFDLRDDGRQRAASIAGFVLDAIPAIGIVTGSDDDAAGGVALANEQGDSRRGARLVGEPDGSAGGADGFRHCGRETIGGEAMVVADKHAFARVFAAHNIARDGVSDDASVRKGKIFGDDAAPAVGAETNRTHWE